MVRAAGLGLALTLAALSCTARASAQSALAETRARYVEGDFAGTIERAERAERDDALDRDELLAVLELRALAQRAIGDEPGADRTLRVVASIHPGHHLGPEVPPVLRARFATLAAASAGPPRVSGAVQFAADGSSARIRAEVEGDPEGVIRRVELRARTDAGPWQDGEGSALALAVAPGARIEWEARAIGPADAEIATSRGEDVVPRTSGGGGDDVAWTIVAIAAGVVAVGVVTGVVVWTFERGVDTDVEGPVLAGLRF